MRLTSRQDIEAPLAFVFAQLSDFDQFERMALRRGAELERVDKLPRPGPGMAWRLTFPFRGKTRRCTVRFLDAEPGNHLHYGAEGDSFLLDARVELMALSPRRTRVTTVGEVKPRTLAARVLIQSLRLAKGKVQKRLDQAAGKLARMIEDKHKGPATR